MTSRLLDEHLEGATSWDGEDVQEQQLWEL